MPISAPWTRTYTHEPRRAILDTAEAFKQQSIVGLVGRVGPGVARRVNAGRAAQRIDLEAQSSANR
jgi:hypothetical protein